MVETRISEEIKELKKEPEYRYYDDNIAVENGVPVVDTGLIKKENQMLIAVTDIDFAERRLELARKNCETGFMSENYTFIERYGQTLVFNGKRTIFDVEKALEGEKHDMFPLRLEKIEE